MVLKIDYDTVKL